MLATACATGFSPCWTAGGEGKHSGPGTGDRSLLLVADPVRGARSTRQSRRSRPQLSLLAADASWPAIVCPLAGSPRGCKSHPDDGARVERDAGKLPATPGRLVGRESGCGFSGAAFPDCCWSSVQDDRGHASWLSGRDVLASTRTRAVRALTIATDLGVVGPSTFGVQLLAALLKEAAERVGERRDDANSPDLHEDVEDPSAGGDRVLDLR